MMHLIHKIKNRHTRPAIIMRQLASMLPAGVPITQCFVILEKTQRQQAIRIMFYKIQGQLLAGNSLYDSLRAHSWYFDNFTCRLIQLGERTGKLDKIFVMLAKHHEDQENFKRKIYQALFYPCLIFTAAIIMTICLFMFVIPAFAELFKDIDHPLPALTRAIFYLSATLQLAWPVLLIIMLVSTIAGIHAYRHGKFIKISDQICQYLPLLRECRDASALIHFTRHLAITLAAGIPILEALSLTSEMNSHARLATIIRQLRAAISAGHTLHAAMAPHTMLPALLQQMVKVGEEAGNLEHMLEKTGELLTAELDARILYLTQLLEPLIMTLLGVLIGGLVTGMYLPVFHLGSTL